MKDIGHQFGKVWVIWSLFFMFPCLLRASTVQWMRFETITLPYEANLVERIERDSQGMMWFATRRGVFSYDGYSTRRICEDNFYASVAMGGDVLCLGGEGGLRWLDLRKEQFVTPYGDVPDVGEVRSLALHKGKLYVGTKSQGVFCLDLKKRIWQRFALPNVKNEIVFAFCPADDGMYIAYHGGLVLDSKERFHDLEIKDNVYAVHLDKTHNRLWIGTEHQLLCRNLIDGSTTTIASGSTYNQIVPSPTGELLLSSEYGLKVLDTETGTIETIAHDAYLTQGSLPNNTIHQIYCDGKNIWISTDRGVAYTQLNYSFEINLLPAITGSHDGNVFTHILLDSKGDTWMGGDNGLLHCTDKGNKWFRVGNGLKKSVIRAIYEDRDHEIWIATDASIARYDSQKDSFSYFSLTDSDGRNANWAYDIYDDDQGRLWIATFMGGLFVVDKQNLLESGGKLRMEANLFKEVDETVNTIFGFLPDANGVLWAKTLHGLASIDTHTLEVSLKQDFFIDNMILIDDVLWIDAKGQLYKLNTRTNKKEATDFFVEDGMIHSFVSENHRLWMSTSAGLCYMDIRDGSVHPFSKPGYNFTTGIYLPRENVLLWGGEDVVCRQLLDNIPQNSTPTQVFLSAVTVGGTPLSGCVPRFEETIRLNAREDIALSIATFAYERKESEVFYYRIGKEGDWHSLPSGTNRILLPRLDGGSYELYLSADTEKGENVVNRYLLMVPYPWYRRWWAWTIYLLTVLSATYFAFRYYRRRENMLFEQRERERVMVLTQQKMDFFEDMSHELKTPLSLIIAPLSKLVSETTNVKLRNSLNAIQNNAIRLNDLIHRILDFKQLEDEGENQVLSSRIDLCRLVANCMEEFSPMAKERGISLTFQATDATILIGVDVVKIQMVVRNILSNALKYVTEGTGKIAIRVEKKLSVASITISDNGPGVPSSDLPKLFNRYYTGQNAREGNGIGLSVVKRYVELHGGEVRAENKDGLSMTFTLPLTTSQTQSYEPIGEGQGEQVLIVDDNHEILDFLSTALEPSYKCLKAQNGEEAMKILDTTIPDLVITDQMMPGIDGTELCCRIRHNHATELIPIIMLTAKDDTTTELKSIRSGADVFMPKPFDVRKLQLHIVQLLNKRKTMERSIRIETMTTANVEAPAQTNDEELMSRIISLIDSNMQSEEFNVTKLCDLLCMDSKQLYRKLKQLTGDTPVNFLRKQRMKRAAALLKQNRFTVAEIMYQIGYSSSSYFTKSFTKEYGVLPKDFK